MTDLVRLPTDKLAYVLAGLTKQGRDRQPDAEADGWVFYRFEGLRGGQGQVGVRADDTEAREAIERASSDRAAVEFWALLTRLVELDGRVGEWCLERAAELVYGPRTPSSHRERQLPGFRSWMALFERGWWTVDGTVDDTAEAKGKAKRRVGRPASHGGAIEGGPLVTVERTSRTSATVRLTPGLAALRERSFVEVPPETFRLPEDDRPNPEGNRPSRCVRTRVQIGGAGAGRWRQRSDQPLSLEEILVGFAGLDLAPVTRRRRLATWFDDLTADLTAMRARGGVGIEERPVPRRPVLRTLLRLVVPLAGARPDAPGRLVPPRAPGRFAPARARAPA